MVKRVSTWKLNQSDIEWVHIERDELQLKSRVQILRVVLLYLMIYAQKEGTFVSLFPHHKKTLQQILKSVFQLWHILISTHQNATFDFSLQTSTVKFYQLRSHVYMV